MTTITSALNVGNTVSALGYTFYLPYIAIALTILFFGVSAVRSNEDNGGKLKRGILASLIADTLIFVVYPVVMPIQTPAFMLILTLIVFGADILVKHK